MKSAILFLALFLGCQSMYLAGLQANDTVAANFMEHVDKSGKLDATQLNELRTAIQNASESDLESLVTTTLTRLYPDYQKAVRASDDDDLATGQPLLSGFSSADDKYLAADASFYLARTLMNHERFEEAESLLKVLSGPLAEFSTHRATVQYYQGLAQGGMLKNDEAIQSLMEFLQFNPDAPERLRVSAWRQIQQLQSIKKGQMDDVYQRMDFSRRRLEIVEPGQQTQVEQENIVKMLKKMIVEQEKKECSNCKGKSDKNSESQPQQQAKKEPQEKSESQTGGQSNVANGKFVDKNFDTGNASPWSRLRDRSRDPANTAIKDKLPARYREIVERYYDAVNGNEGSSSPDGNK